MKNKDALGSPKRFGHNWKKFKICGIGMGLNFFTNKIFLTT